ncbi:hypothetical protein F518_24194 [Serratia marcescens VGH107]|nr:hypothetical protein F518_24194 [Serratia marcescens VGH107]
MRCRVDGRIAMGVEKDRLITEGLALQVAVEITAAIAGLSHFCQKIARMAAVPAPVVSGGMAVLQEMVMAAMVLGRERPGSSEPNAN